MEPKRHINLLHRSEHHSLRRHVQTHRERFRGKQALPTQKKIKQNKLMTKGATRSPTLSSSLRQAFSLQAPQRPIQNVYLK
jgi:hypothetical protein